MKSNIKKFSLNLLLVIFICTFLYSAYKVIMWLKFDRETKKLETGLYSEVVSTDKNDNEEKGNSKTIIDFEALKEVNKDVIGWIKIDNTHINYPILQGETDQYYLRKDIYKKYNYSGSIFVYTDVNKNLEDENTVIYGHNMKNQRMFADLYEIYKEQLGKDIDIEIITPSKNEVYKVFSCYKSLPILEIVKGNFNNEDEKKEYVDTAVKRSKINFETEIDYSKKIITLITCGSSSKERIIVHAICK